MDQGKTVIIIGAGIVGVSTAIWLQRAGHRVTVFDPLGPAGGTSYGNAGVLAASSVVPVTVPGLLRKVPGMLFDRDSPLFLRWRHLPGLLPFFLRYLRHCTDTAVDKAGEALTLLLHDTFEQHRALASGTPAERYLCAGDYIYGYADEAAFRADAYGWSKRRGLGFSFEEMDATRLAEYDPFMADRFGFAVRCGDHGHITDPGAYVVALATHAEDLGVQFVREAVTDVDVDDGAAKAVVSDSGMMPADDIVLAAGIWSNALARKLGLNVPMEAERGYHIEFINPSTAPRSPIMVASGKFVMTPMEGRLRCAGVVEFATVDAPASRAPFDLLKRQTLRLLPGLTYDRIEEWMGMRPATSDSLPAIGLLPSVSNVWAGFGHQHVGLTAGPKTGRLLSMMINGEKPNLNLYGFRPGRFLD